VQGFSHLRVIPHCIRSMASGGVGLGKETAEVACTAISAKVAALVSSMWQGTWNPHSRHRGSVPSSETVMLRL